MKDTAWSALNLAFQLGYLIALPIAFLGFGGALLDKKLNTSPLFLLIGVVLAATISSLAVYKKVKSINSQKT